MGKISVSKSKYVILQAIYANMTFIDLLINGILVFIMLGIGLSLTPDSFGATFSKPRSFLTGSFLQILVLPTLAFCIAGLSTLSPPLRVGIIILAACPGGITSNFISYLLRGNPALSISLTVTNSFLAPITIPLIVNLGISLFLDASFQTRLQIWDTVLQIFIIVVIPVGIGVLIKRRFPYFALRAERLLRWTSVVMLALLFLIKFFAAESQGGAGLTRAEVFHILPYSVLINLVALFTGYGVARLMRLEVPDQLTLSIEIGIQNTSLGFLIASLLGSEEMLKPALIYAMFTFFTALLFGLWVKPSELEPLRKRIKAQWKRKFPP